MYGLQNKAAPYDPSIVNVNNYNLIILTLYIGIMVCFGNICTMFEKSRSWSFNLYFASFEFYSALLIYAAYTS